LIEFLNEQDFYSYIHVSRVDDSAFIVYVGDIMIKSLHELAKEFPDKSYNELEKMRQKTISEKSQDELEPITSPMSDE